MLFIGGNEGSGTRMITTYCMKAGYNKVGRTNESHDAMDMVPFYNRWTKKYLDGSYTEHEDEMRKQFVDAVELQNGNHKRSFVKLPQNLLLLPFIHSVYPDMKFIHIVRDGRAMAFSSNRRHVKHYGDLFLDGVKPIFLNKMSVLWSPEKAINFWAKTNIAAFNYGTEHMKENYLLIKYEPLCTKVQKTNEMFADFIECDYDVIPSMMRKAKITDTFKRGTKNKPKKVIQTMQNIAGRDTFKMLGYKPRYYK